MPQPQLRVRGSDAWFLLGRSSDFVLKQWESALALRKPPTNAVDREIGESVRRKRREFGFQVEDVTRALAISAGSYRKLEAGSHRFKAVQLLAVARIFGISPTVFFEEIAMKNANILYFEKPIAK